MVHKCTLSIQSELNTWMAGILELCMLRGPKKSKGDSMKRRKETISDNFVNSPFLKYSTTNGLLFSERTCQHSKYTLIMTYQIYITYYTTTIYLPH